MKILDNREENGEISATVEHSDRFSTFGGEYRDGDYELKEYGLDMGEISFYDLSPTQMKHLGIQIISHLMSCGHQFETLKDCNGEYLREKS